MFNEKVVFISGGSGFLGKNLIKYILKNYSPKKIISFSRSEAKQYEAQCELDDPNIPNNGKIRWVTGSITNYKALSRAIADSDIVLHCGALKRVQNGVYNPHEMIDINITGTQNIIMASIENYVEKVVFVSSDKSVNPVLLYGQTKAIGEKLIQTSHIYKKSHGIDLVAVRYGNVVNSTGSVIPFYKKLISEGADKLPCTDVHMTRFSITIEQAIETIMIALENASAGQIVVPKIPSYRLIDLITAFGKEYELIGVRDCEKIDEEMISIYDNVEERFNYYLIHHYANDKTKNGISYTSNKNEFLKISELKELIK